MAAARPRIERRWHAAQAKYVSSIIIKLKPESIRRASAAPGGHLLCYIASPIRNGRWAVEIWLIQNVQHHATTFFSIMLWLYLRRLCLENQAAQARAASGACHVCLCTMKHGHHPWKEARRRSSAGVGSDKRRRRLVASCNPLCAVKMGNLLGKLSRNVCWRRDNQKACINTSDDGQQRKRGHSNHERARLSSKAMRCWRAVSIYQLTRPIARGLVAPRNHHPSRRAILNVRRAF